MRDDALQQRGCLFPPISLIPWDGGLPVEQAALLNKGGGGGGGVEAGKRTTREQARSRSKAMVIRISTINPLQREGGGALGYVAFRALHRLYVLQDNGFSLAIAQVHKQKKKQG